MMFGCMPMAHGEQDSHDGSSDSARSKTAPDLLKERYARGDIGRDEYLEKLADISERDGVTPSPAQAREG